MNDMFIPLLICFLSAYLIGAIPFGLLLARMHKIDLRQIGSGNIGATNVTRALGRSWGITCFFLDALKGILPVALALIWLKPKVLETGYSGQVFIWLWLGVGLLAIMGHVFPIYLGFRGGKGVATSFGVALGIWPYYSSTALIALVIWLIVLYRWKYVSLASIAATIAFPLVLLIGIFMNPHWSLTELWPLALTSMAIPTMVVLRHRSNITRLRTGTENRIGNTSKEN